MRRVIVTVSILLLLLVGIPLIVFGAWLMSQENAHDDPAMGDALFIYGGPAVIIGSFLCLAALPLGVWYKPWRERIVRLLFKLPIWTEK